MSLLTYQGCGEGPTTLFFLHYLGGSARSWQGVLPHLQSTFRCIAIDLPGFGDSANNLQTSVEEMAGLVRDVIEAEHPAQWVLVGHSLGAKVAAVIARKAEDGDPSLSGLQGVVLLAGSPPAPEPMEESRRETMKEWFSGDAAESRKQAGKFVDNNSHKTLPDAERELLMQDLLRMNRQAWLAWLDAGSREDWSRRVGVLGTPALLLAGEKDKDLGPEAQHALMLPHFPQSRVQVIQGAQHLLPMERPEEVARLIEEAARGFQKATASRNGEIPAEYQALIGSDRVSQPTRDVLQARARRDADPYSPTVLTPEEFWTLRAVLQRIIPQRPDVAIDLAGALDRQHSEEGDGWRFSDLPADAEAYRAGLLTLDMEARSAHKHPFSALEGQEQDALLTKAFAGSLGEGRLHHAAASFGVASPAPGLTAAQMKLWFKDLASDAVKLYVAHPATLARMGYSGIADGADTRTAQGFVSIGIGVVESWEPEPLISRPRASQKGIASTR